MNIPIERSSNVLGVIRSLKPVFLVIYMDLCNMERASKLIPFI